LQLWLQLPQYSNYMGGVKQRQLELEASGLNEPRDTHVCHVHIKDYAIEEFIKENAQPGYCSYCKRRRNVVEFEMMMKFIMEGIMRLYEDAAEFMQYDSSEGGYQGTIYDQQELIDDVVGLKINNDQLREDIINCIDDRAWSDPTEYYEDERQILQYLWKYFKDVVKHRSRYLFAKSEKLKSFSFTQNAYSILDDIGDRVRDFGLLKKIAKNTIFYRCRQHRIKDVVDTASKIASPPIEHAIYANRMSPAGISMFYGAFERGTARIETIDEAMLAEKPKLSTAVFKNKEVLNVVDLTELPSIPSIFDRNKREKMYSIGFIRDFVSDLSRPIAHDGLEHIEYIPTQVVTEYFRDVYEVGNNEPIHGIVYPSSRKIGSKACVLFMDNEECLEKLRFVQKSLRTEDI